MQKATSLQRTQVLEFKLQKPMSTCICYNFVLFNHIPKLFNNKKKKRMKVKQGTTERKRKNHTFEQDKTNSRRKF